MYISIVIPTLNEESGINATLKQISILDLERMGFEVEVMIVDGNSVDRTREIGSRNGALVILEERKGYGRAYKTGFARCRGDVIVTLDADGTYPAERIPEYISYLLKENIDFITINRFGRLEKGAMSFAHKVGNRILSFTVRLLFGIRIKDSQSGMWIFRRSILDPVRPESDGMPFSEELKILAFRNCHCVELDGEYRPRIGQPKLATIRDGWINFKHLWNLWKGKH